jgi:hypothetical protein
LRVRRKEKNMTAVAHEAAARSVPRPSGRLWLKWGLAVFAVVETVHFSTGLLVNDWEGWGAALGVLAFVIITGVVIVGLTYGVLVRWGLKPSPKGRNRPALAALVAGVLSIVSYVAFFMWAPVLIAPAAVLLGRVGLAKAGPGREGRVQAAAGTILGLVSLAVLLGLLTYEAFNHGNYPPPFDG